MSPNQTAFRSVRSNYNRANALKWREIFHAVMDNNKSIVLQKHKLNYTVSTTRTKLSEALLWLVHESPGTDGFRTKTEYQAFRERVRFKLTEQGIAMMLKRAIMLPKDLVTVIEDETTTCTPEDWKQVAIDFMESERESITIEGFIFGVEEINWAHNSLKVDGIGYEFLEKNRGLRIWKEFCKEKGEV